MCGIFGIINGKHYRNTSLNTCNLVTNGIMTNSVRGADSTGIMQLDSKNIYFFKAPVNGANFVRLPETQGYINDADRSLFTVVHNRAATEGAVSTDNAHPFDHIGTKNNYVLGVHNGTLRNWKPKDSTFQVDSDWAIAELTNHGIEALKTFQGAYAFVWYDDAEPGVLQFARNAERPMFVMFIKGQNRMIFASEHQMVAWLAERNNLSLEPEIIELAPSYHYKFQLDNPKEFTKQYYSAAATGVVQPVVVGPINRPLLTEKEALNRRLAAIFGPIAQEIGNPPAVKKDTEAAVPYVTADEVRVAKNNLMFKEEIEFNIEHYDEAQQLLWGSIVDTGGEVCAAVIRRVLKSTYQTWEMASSLSGKVWGAFEHDMEGNNNVVYVVGRGVTMKPAIDEETSPLAAAVAKSMVLFNEDKQNEPTARNITKH